jgi:thiol-disulfide isomerase/thioredoxin
MQKKIIYLIALVLAVFIGYYFYQKYRVAPDLTVIELPLQNLQRDVVSLDKFKGSKTIVCFSASWCGPCRAELKMLAELKQSTLKDVTIVVISDERIDEIQTFMQSFPPSFEWLNLLQPFSAIGINSIPTAYLLNTKGNIVHKNVGFIDWEDPSTANYLLGLMK